MCRAGNQDERNWVSRLGIVIRRGILFDRTPGALEPIDFELEVGSKEYDALWPWGEAWCQELEVFHNIGISSAR